MEKIMAHSVQTVKHYHVDKSRFSDNEFVGTINEKYQKLTFCGVVLHHQNGSIENKNKILTTGARTILLNGIIMWTQIID